MKELHILSIDHGHVMITIEEMESASGEIFYEGRMFDTEGIVIFDSTKDGCLSKLKLAIDTGLRFWLRMQISELGIFMSKD